MIVTVGGEKTPPAMTTLGSPVVVGGAVTGVVIGVVVVGAVVGVVAVVGTVDVVGGAVVAVVGTVLVVGTVAVVRVVIGGMVAVVVVVGRDVVVGAVVVVVVVGKVCVVDMVGVVTLVVVSSALPHETIEVTNARVSSRVSAKILFFIFSPIASILFAAPPGFSNLSYFFEVRAARYKSPRLPGAFLTFHEK